MNEETDYRAVAGKWFVIFSALLMIELWWWVFFGISEKVGTALALTSAVGLLVSGVVYLESY